MIRQYFIHDAKKQLPQLPLSPRAEKPERAGRSEARFLAACFQQVSTPKSWILVIGLIIHNSYSIHVLDDCIFTYIILVDCL